MNECRERIRSCKNVLLSTTELDGSFNTEVEENRNVSQKHGVSGVEQMLELLWE